MHHQYDTDQTQLQAAVEAARNYLCRPEMERRARVYLRDRGIDLADLPTSVGYAPPGWRNLTNALRPDFPPEVLVAAGLSRRSSKGTVYDVFRDRIIFPIHDHAGAVVGFTARDLSGLEATPKYLNTPATALFRKSELFYSPILGHPDGATPVLVEGPVDALAITARHTELRDLHALATLGTTLTDAHLTYLQAHTAEGTVVVAMDGDSAGRTAALRHAERLWNVGLTPRIVVLPNGLDPADYLAIHGHDLQPFQPRNALPLLALQVQDAIAKQDEDMQWVEGRTRAAKTVVAKLATYPASYAVPQIGWIADVLNVNADVMLANLGEAYATRRTLPPPSTHEGRLLRATHHSLQPGAPNLDALAAAGPSVGR